MILGLEAAAFGVVKFDADSRLFADRAFRLGLKGYEFGCGVVANRVVLELDVVQCELEYVLYVFFGPGLVWFEGYQTPTSSLGSGNL